MTSAFFAVLAVASPGLRITSPVFFAVFAVLSVAVFVGLLEYFQRFQIGFFHSFLVYPVGPVPARSKGRNGPFAHLFAYFPVQPFGVEAGQLYGPG